MAKRKRKFLRLNVSQTVEYLIDMDHVNGMTDEEVIEEWFKKFPLDRHHAARDHWRVGNSTKLVAVKNKGIISEGDDVTD